MRGCSIREHPVRVLLLPRRSQQLQNTLEQDIIVSALASQPCLAACLVAFHRLMEELFHANEVRVLFRRRQKAVSGILRSVDMRSICPQ